MKIIEESIHLGKKYSKVLSNGTIIKEVSIFVIQRKIDDKYYFVMLDLDGTDYDNVYRYLNVELRGTGVNNRSQKATALKMLYTYLSLFDIDHLKDLTETHVRQLIEFLKGGTIGMLDGITIRSHATINNYLSTYRSYFKYLKIDNALLDKSVTKITRGGGGGFLAHTQSTSHVTYRYKLSEASTNKSPDYISKPKYDEIIKLVNSKYTLRDHVIIKLMYEYGLRIGEVLGLTIEDIVLDEGNEGGLLYLRNRASDKKWQLAKGAMNILDSTTYHRPEYWKENLGYQVINLTPSMMELLLQYIEETFFNPFISAVLESNLKNKNKADKITDREDVENNYYIFVSKNFTPLSSSGWNKIIKSIFEQVGVPVDKHNKQTNLNHKFRHGYAMFIVNNVIHKMDDGVGKVILQDMLRHKNESTVSIYYNPTREDKAEIASYIEGIMKGTGIEHE